MSISSFFSRHSVDDSSELQRILAIPRREWTEADLENLAWEMTALLKTPNGSMRLRPLQALALHDLACYGGLFGPLRVGSGKTLISLLAPYMVDAQRPTLILPAGLIARTERDIAELKKHWKIPTNTKLVSYEMLGRVQGADILNLRRPDFLAMDEGHRAKNRKAGVTRRITRYLREHPDTKVMAISGTMMKNSLKDFAHIMRWCLPPESCPIPVSDGELSEWADCLDERVNPLQRRGPGALLKLCSQEELQAPPLQAARMGFGRRMTDTAAVVSSSGEGVTCSLYVKAITYDVAPIVDTYFKKLREEWTTPDDWDLMEAIEVWRIARELSLGLHYVWDPRPPESWMVKRKLWAKFVRGVLSDSHTLDTELQVKHSCLNGDLDRQAFDEWTQIAPSFVPNSKPIWHDDAALNLCQEWGEKEPGIIWCEHTFFARELERRSGLVYYGREGKDSRGNLIESADPRKTVIASVAANSTGRNLQAWNRNLVTSPPTGADAWEQMIGRTHREGQLSDQVEVDVLVGCKEHFEAWTRGRSGAEMARDTMGQTQKILLADVIFPTAEDIEKLTGNRWRSAKATSGNTLTSLLYGTG